MTIKNKFFLYSIPFSWNSYRARKLVKKDRKALEDKKFSEQFKNDWVVKKAKKLAKVLKIDLKIKGWDNLPKPPALLASNHASNFDSLLIMLALQNTQEGEDYKNIQSVFVAKKELQKVKKYRGYMEFINTFFIDRDNIRQSLQLLKSFFAYAKKNKKMGVIFPAGTRHLKGQIGEFKPGAFKYAKNEFFPIVPVTINNSWAILESTRQNRIKVEVIFGQTIKPMSLLALDTFNIAKKVQAAVKNKWIEPQNIKKL